MKRLVINYHKVGKRFVSLLSRSSEITIAPSVSNLPWINERSQKVLDRNPTIAAFSPPLKPRSHILNAKDTDTLQASKETSFS